MHEDSKKVEVGLGTQVGYGTGLVAFVLAVIAYFGGHGGDEDTINTIVTGAISLGMLGVTTLGRMLQRAAKDKGFDPKSLEKFGKVDIDEDAIKRAVEEAMRGGLSKHRPGGHGPTDLKPMDEPVAPPTLS